MFVNIPYMDHMGYSSPGLETFLIIFVCAHGKFADGSLCKQVSTWYRHEMIGLPSNDDIIQFMCLFNAGNPTIT